MARKATPEELAMNQSAAEELAKETDLQELLEKANAPATDNTAAGDIEVDTVKPVRKRGRPSKAESSLNDILEKETPTGGEAPAANKPGRKPGKKSQPSAEALGKQLVGIHALAAMMLQIPEIQLRDDEGVALGSAVIAVCEEYNLSVTGKTGAAIQLLAAAAMIYAPRAFVVKARLDAARAARESAPTPTAGNIHAFAPGSN